jgi:hypothetical protein
MTASGSITFIDVPVVFSFIVKFSIASAIHIFTRAPINRHRQLAIGFPPHLPHFVCADEAPEKPFASLLRSVSRTASVKSESSFGENK